MLLGLCSAMSLALMALRDSCHAQFCSDATLFLSSSTSSLISILNLLYCQKIFTLVAFRVFLFLPLLTLLPFV